MHRIVLSITLLMFETAGDFTQSNINIEKIRLNAQILTFKSFIKFNKIANNSIITNVFRLFFHTLHRL